MKLKSVNNMTRNFGKMRLKARKYTPEMLVIAGVAGVVVSAVMACKATLKLSEVTEEAKESIDKIHEATEHPENLPEKYTEEDSKKDLSIVYAQTGVKLVKLYAPAVVLGALSITAIATSNNILRKRNIALAAAYTAVDTSFKEYRGRVVERFGTDLDRELRYNIKKEEIEETVVDEKGKEKTIKKTVDVADPNTYSDYAKFFQEGCLGWTKDPEHNLYFLKCTQAQANDRLKREGYLFLNDVYQMLGIDRTRAGQQVGWIYDEENPIGDNFIDFGIYDEKNPATRRFVNGNERVILLDFNVDGPILNLI